MSAGHGIAQAGVGWPELFASARAGEAGLPGYVAQPRESLEQSGLDRGFVEACRRAFSGLANRLPDAGVVAVTSPYRGEGRSSVAAGLAALRSDDGIVLVHDAARCLAPPDLFARVIHAVRAGHPTVVPGLAMTDTVKVVDAQGRVLATPDRESLRRVQTPQGFLREVLEHAHASGASATDDAGLVEQIGGHVRVVDGDPLALKVTSASDLAVATALLQDVPHAD